MIDAKEYSQRLFGKDGYEGTLASAGKGSLEAYETTSENRYVNRIKKVMIKPLEWYVKAYIEHPVLTTVATFAAQTAIAMYIGNRLMGSVPCTMGQPGHLEDIYRYEEEARMGLMPMMIDDDMMMYIPYEYTVQVPVEVIGQKLVESTLQTFSVPIGSIIGSIIGMMTSLFTIGALESKKDEGPDQTCQKTR